MPRPRIKTVLPWGAERERERPRAAHTINQRYHFSPREQEQRESFVSASASQSETWIQVRCSSPLPSCPFRHVNSARQEGPLCAPSTQRRRCCSKTGDRGPPPGVMLPPPPSCLHPLQATAIRGLWRRQRRQVPRKNLSPAVRWTACWESVWARHAAGAGRMLGEARPQVALALH